MGEDKRESEDLGEGNHNQKIFYEKNLFPIKENNFFKVLWISQIEKNHLATHRLTLNSSSLAP